MSWSMYGACARMMDGQGAVVGLVVGEHDARFEARPRCGARSRTSPARGSPPSGEGGHPRHHVDRRLEDEVVAQLGWITVAPGARGGAPRSTTGRQRFPRRCGRAQQPSSARRGSRRPPPPRASAPARPPCRRPARTASRTSCRGSSAAPDPRLQSAAISRLRHHGHHAGCGRRLARIDATMRAWAWGERTKAAWAMRGSLRSLGRCRDQPPSARRCAVGRRERPMSSSHPPGAGDGTPVPARPRRSAARRIAGRWRGSPCSGNSWRRGPHGWWRRSGPGRALEQILRRSGACRRAEPALQRVLSRKSSAGWRDVPAPRRRPDGLHLAPVGLYGQHQASADDRTVDPHGARPHTPCSHPTCDPVRSSPRGESPPRLARRHRGKACAIIHAVDDERATSTVNSADEVTGARAARPIQPGRRRTTSGRPSMNSPHLSPEALEAVRGPRERRRPTGSMQRSGTRTCGTLLAVQRA